MAELKHYGQKGMRWGKQGTGTGDDYTPPSALDGGGNLAGEYDPAADAKTLLDLKPTIAEINATKRSIVNPNKAEQPVWDIVTTVNKLLGDKRSTPVRRLDWSVRTKRFLDGLFGKK